MKIQNLQELKKLIRLLKAEGVDAIEVDNIKMNLIVEPKTLKKQEKTPDEELTVPVPNVKQELPTTWEELTEDQKLAWSTNAN